MTEAVAAHCRDLIRSAVLGLGKVLYDPLHQPQAPEGWIFRTLLGLAALMRSFGAVLAIQTSAILLGLPLATLHLWIPMPRRLGERFLQALPDTVMALLVSWLLLRYAHQLKLNELGLTLDKSAWKEGLVSTLAGGLSLALIVAPGIALGWARFEVAESKVGGVYGLLVLLVLLALAAFSEELILRGYAFQTLIHPLDLLGALIVTSGAFAALHSGNKGANEYTIANTFLAGCALGMILAWRRNLWAAVGAHFGWNLATILFGLNVSGIVVPLMPFKLTWSIDPIWTGGNYGPEGGLICTILLSLLLLGLIRLYYHREQGAVVAE
jgi:membrane protease YdiL (CAAX protease family)